MASVSQTRCRSDTHTQTGVAYDFTDFTASSPSWMREFGLFDGAWTLWLKLPQRRPLLPQYLFQSQRDVMFRIRLDTWYLILVVKVARKAEWTEWNFVDSRALELPELGTARSQTFQRQRLQGKRSSIFSKIWKRHLFHVFMPCTSLYSIYPIFQVHQRHCFAQSTELSWAKWSYKLHIMNMNEWQLFGKLRSRLLSGSAGAWGRSAWYTDRKPIRPTCVFMINSSGAGHNECLQQHLGDKYKNGLSILGHRSVGAHSEHPDMLVPEEPFQFQSATTSLIYITLYFA